MRPTKRERPAPRRPCGAAADAGRDGHERQSAGEMVHHGRSPFQSCGRTGCGNAPGSFAALADAPAPGRRRADAFNPGCGRYPGSLYPPPKPRMGVSVDPWTRRLAGRSREAASRALSGTAGPAHAGLDPGGLKASDVDEPAAERRPLVHCLLERVQHEADVSRSAARCWVSEKLRMRPDPRSQLSSFRTCSWAPGRVNSNTPGAVVWQRLQSSHSHTMEMMWSTLLPKVGIE